MHRDRTIFGTPLKLPAESPRLRGSRLPKKGKQSKLHLPTIGSEPDSPRPSYTIILILRFLRAGIYCMPVDLFDPCNIRPKAVRVCHEQNEVYIGIRARSSASMRADQSDGSYRRLRLRPSEDDLNDALDALAIAPGYLRLSFIQGISAIDSV
jgi:hypothetical protein